MSMVDVASGVIRLSLSLGSEWVIDKVSFDEDQHSFEC